MAERSTTFPIENEIVVTIKVYETDGVTVMKESQITTTVLENGDIREVVT